jgi:ketosteroid isomerase-like protein
LDFRYYIPTLMLSVLGRYESSNLRVIGTLKGLYPKKDNRWEYHMHRYEVRDQEIRAALDQHWAASDANDFETEHRIYREDAVLEYPQSGERTRGRRNIQNQRASQPSKKRFAVRRIIGGDDLWITEFILTYDGKPSYTVSIMEFRDGKVARETQYFADPFVVPAWRAQWVERMDT